MTENHWLEGDAAQALIDEVVATLVRRYRIDEAAARSAVREAFAGNAALRQIVARENSPARIMRTRVFKDAVANLKRSVYYGLRRYSADETKQHALIARLSEMSDAAPESVEALALEIAATHASTRERLDGRDDFYRQLFSLIDAPRTILDVGSGVQPLVFPFSKLEGTLACYTAIDKDASAVAAVNAFARACGERRLRALRWDIREGWSPELTAFSDGQKFDVAFLFKVITVVARQQPELLPVLATTPARVWVVTGSKQSLTKRQDIERRERNVLLEFCESAGRRVASEFSAGEEFGFILKEA